MLRGYPKSSILCAIWVSTLADIALSHPWVALTCFWKLLPSTLFVKGRLWTISAAMNVSHCSTSSNFPVLRRYLKSDFFCAIWESTFRYITPCDPYLAYRCFQKLLPSPLYIKGRAWTTSSAIDVFPYSTAPRFPCWEGTPNLAFCVQFECQPWLTLYCLAHEWLLHAFGSSSHLLYSLKEDYEPFRQPWMSFIVAHHPTFQCWEGT